MEPSELSLEELATLIEQLREENKQLREENEHLREENEKLRETVEKQSAAITRLEAEVKRFKNAPTPPRRKGPGETASGRGTDDDSGDGKQSASTGDDSDQDEARTDGGTVGRNQGHEPTWHDLGNIDDVKDVLLEDCPDCGDYFGSAIEVITRIIEEIPDPHAHRNHPIQPARVLLRPV